MRLTLALSVLPVLARADLRSSIQSAGVDALYPGDSGYATAATAYNKRLEYAPVAVAYPNNTAQVAALVKAGAAEGVSVNARSGGHSYAAYGLGGASNHLVVDLSRMTSITVDDTTHQASIGAGNRLGDIALALNDHGRAMSHGTCPYVGIGGHAGMGGYGYTSRQWGLTLDNLIGAEVVLANGTIAEVSSSAYPDLFWAIRGASPSFGIVTSMTFQTYAAPSSASMYSYSYDLDASGMATALRAWQTFGLSSKTPKELGGAMVIGKGSSSGRVGVTMQGSYYADSKGLQDVLQPLLSALPSPSSDSVKTTDWIGNLQILAGSQAMSTSGVQLSDEHDTFYAKSITTPSSSPMSNKSVEAFASYLTTDGYSTDLSWFIEVDLYGGPTSVVATPPSGANSTAFAQRGTLFTFQLYASSSNAQPPYPDSGYTFLDGMAKSITDNADSGWKYGAYANYIDDRLSTEEWRSLYYGDNYARLSSLKGIYDPTNVFDFPQAISPAK